MRRIYEITNVIHERDLRFNLISIKYPTTFSIETRKYYNFENYRITAILKQVVPRVPWLFEFNDFYQSHCKIFNFLKPTIFPKYDFLKYKIVDFVC